MEKWNDKRPVQGFKGVIHSSLPYWASIKKLRVHSGFRAEGLGFLGACLGGCQEVWSKLQPKEP